MSTPRQHKSRQRPTLQLARKEALGLLLFILLMGSFLLWFLPAANALEKQYDEISAALQNEATFVATARVNNDRVAIPSWNFFARDNIWSLVSKQRSISVSYVPKLSNVTVAHTAGTVQVAKTMHPALVSLFKAASADGVQLMLSSAYRSAEAQQRIYDGYLRLYGQSYVNSYVALPGTSEHQTGLAVDIASASTDCKTTADDCSLNYDAIVWLGNNASRFGFIQRYPAGKQSITGVAGEAWHYRYVGTELARLLSNSGMTLDEFVQQIAPGYAR